MSAKFSKELDPRLPWQIRLTEPQGRWEKRKYIASHDGIEVELDSVTTVLGEAFGLGEELIVWSLREALLDVLASFGQRSPDAIAHDDVLAEHMHLLDTIKGWVEAVQLESKSKKTWSFEKLCAKLHHNLKPPEVPANFDWIKLGEIVTQAQDARWRTLDKAAQLGTRAHELIEDYVRNGLKHWDGYDPSKEAPEVLNAVAAAVKFFDHWGFAHHSAEVRVFDVRLGVGGTLDALVRDRDGNLVLLDYKTSSGVYGNHLVQAVAYAHMWQRQTGEQVGRGYIIRLDKKTAQVEVVPVWSNDIEFLILCQQWWRCVATFRWKAAVKKYLDTVKKHVVIPVEGGVVLEKRKK